MARRIKKNIALVNRRKELDEELRNVQRELRQRIRGEKTLSDPVAVLRRIWPGSEESPESSVSSPGVAEQPVAQPVAAKTPDRPVGTEAEGGGEVRTNGPIRRGDARFASYFVTGGLHGIEPLRQEKSILRARAIAWLVLCLFILTWLYWKFF